MNRAVVGEFVCQTAQLKKRHSAEWRFDDDQKLLRVHRESAGQFFHFCFDAFYGCRIVGLSSTSAIR
jgi:hypothetical protein